MAKHSFIQSRNATLQVTLTIQNVQEKNHQKLDSVIAGKLV